MIKENKKMNKKILGINNYVMLIIKKGITGKNEDEHFA